MNKISKLCVGPMSLPVIDALCEYANKHDRPIMLIASRNQIECKELGGGYVNNFNTSDYSKYIKSKDKKKNIILCRDHTGPFLADKEKSNSLKESMEKTKASIRNDIESDFNFIHIDTSLCKKKYDIAEELLQFSIDFSKSKNKKIKFEFGTEEHGVEVALSKFREDISFASKFKDIKFVVGQTGSLCKEVYQVGGFNFRDTQKMVDHAKKYNILLKEHNGDYLSKKDLLLRKISKIGALNVAPQFGVEQTKTIFYLANIYGEFNLLNKYISYTLMKNKWKKWSYGNTSNNIKFLSSGHYFFSSSPYKKLIYALDKKVNTNKVIKNNITLLTEHYFKNL